MDVQANAVPCPVREAGHLVVRAKAGVGDHLAGGGVHVFAGGADLRRCECGCLGLVLQAPDVSLSLGGLAKDTGAADVRVVAFYAAHAVHEHDVAFLEAAGFF